MSVIVQGMDKPERCDLCPFYRIYEYLPVVSCKAVNKLIVHIKDPEIAADLELEPPDWCPIKPLPERKTGRWIPVAERKPDKRDIYLVTLDDGCCPITYVALWKDGKWVSAEVWEDIFLLDDTKITAWKPLPKPFGKTEQVRDDDECNR